ncbi:alpha/beta fold hydrolase [Amycolatopsis pithecellobii]|uniref:Alpha/beta fold hydrolase n=1 Tax=Amycolatopsis pithecellobii TaxID=664692 RepID=A0A6N7YN42_9PSEU|nr:alpha/beta hydrolase [Amycolatopsis pithecellobii]MTD54407.1 alpha/beta fold hydrolase [Amycolatopsis pithecellobii]
MSLPTDTGTVRTVRRTGETSICYSVTGPPTGLTWVFIHGWGCRRTDFAPVAAFLPADHRVITIDLPGHGGSRTARDSWTMEEFARDVAAVTDAEHVDRCVVVGHSLGGAVAIEYARLRPDVVTRVIGLDAYHYLALYPAIDDAAARPLLEGFETDFPAAVRGLVTMGSIPGTDPEFGETIFRKMSGIPQSVGVAALAGMLRWDMDEALQAVSQPVTTLAVRGLLDPEAVARYGDRIDFVVHELGSHHFLIEQPEETAKLLMAAIR